MTDPTVNLRLLDVAKDLDVTAENLSDDVKAIKQDERKRKFQFSILALSVVLDLLLSGGFFYALHTTSDAQNKISGQLYANCQSTNEEHKRRDDEQDDHSDARRQPGAAGGRTPC